MSNTDLSTLGLSADAIASRVRSIGGSDANVIMSGDEAAILRLWEQKTGRRDPEDLSDVLPVVMGQFTEALNVAWFKKQTGLHIDGEQTVMAHPKDNWRTATLDGFVKSEPGAFPLGVFEAKHVGQFWKDDAILAKYSPQLYHNMSITGLDRAHLSVFKGNADWLHFEVTADADYAVAVRKAELAFWYAVQADEPPVPYDIPPPPAAEAMRAVDMTGNNAWGALAADWLANVKAAKVHEKAAKELKALVEPDVKLATGHGVCIKRSKVGALTISEAKPCSA